MGWKVFVLYFIVCVYVLYNFCFIICVCVCVGACVCVCEICVCIGNIYTSAEIPKTQILKKHLLLFVKRFIYIYNIYLYCAGRCLWALQCGTVRVSEGDALGLTAHSS